jgi:hypothetical protein
MTETKKADPVDALRKAVEAARKAGLQVKVSVTKNDEGVTTTENL